MTAFVVIVIGALIVLILSGLKTDRSGRKYVEDLHSGRLFRGFEVYKYTKHLDTMLALDRKNRKVAFARATYFTRRFGEPKHVPVTIEIDFADIKDIKPYAWTDGKGSAYRFELNRPIPPENDSNDLLISGVPEEISAIVDEIKQLMQTHQ